MGLYFSVSAECKITTTNWIRTNIYTKVTIKVFILIHYLIGKQPENQLNYRQYLLN